MARIQFLCILAIAVVFCAYSQSTGTATLVGTVTDETGASIPAAKITVTNVDTSFVHNTETGPRGDYYVPYLNPGPYRLEVEAAGFKKYAQDGIVLRTNEQPRVNVQLEIGTLTESIEVTSAPPLLETETAGSGQILEGNTVVKIPVMQKFVHRTLLYMPGMTNINGQHALGQRQRALGYTLDGVSGKEPVIGQVGQYRNTVIASLDSIQEFKLWTTGMPAEFGHAGGGLLSAVFRSGTNSFHGSFEDRYTNGALIHRRYFERLKRTGAFDYHEWGGTIGGPIVKDKTFFFFGFQQHYENVSETFIGQVPSPEMYAGNFNFGGIGYPIYDPMTTEEVDGSWVRQPFPNNQIPQSRFDPVAANLIAENPWKEQTDPGTMTPNGPQENLVIPAFGKYKFERYDVKIDHQFSAMHKIFGRYSQVRHRSQTRPIRELTEIVFGRVYVKPEDLRNVVLSDTYTLNPTTINEFRLGYNRKHFTAIPESYNEDWAGRLGIPNVTAATFPEFRNSGGGYIFNLGPGGRSETVGEDFTLQNNFTKIFGRHTMKMGYELIHTRYNSKVAAFQSGLYRMGGTEFPFQSNTGHPFASLLLGTVVRADFEQDMATWLPRWWQHALYIQDSWKIGQNLSLQLGLRWSYESPFKTKWGQQSQFDPDAIDPLTGRPGAIVHGPGELASRDFSNFQPRLGLAYNFHPKWVFRSSFGLMTIDLMTRGTNQNFEEYLARAVVQANPGDPRHSFTLSQGPPDISFDIAPDGSVPFQGTNYSGRNVSWYDPKMRMPYVMSWSAGLQYQFTSAWLMEVLYQGSAGVGLLNAWDMNAIPLNISNDLDELETIYRAQQNYKPWNHFGAIRHYSNYGHNTYHGGTLRFEKRYSAGLSLNAFYTFSKTINEADNDANDGGITFYNRRLEKGRANYDITHRFVSLLTYELPFGQGRRWLGSGVASHIFGNFEFAWTQTFQSGPPVTASFGGTTNHYLAGDRRPNVVVPHAEAQVKDWEIGPDRFPFSAQNRYFHFDAFEYPAPFTTGGVGRNTLEAPGLRWTQLSLAKTIPITERINIIVRWDLNNATKEPQFANPNTQFNLSNTANFGTFSGTRGSFSDIGTSRMHHIFVARIVF